MSGKRLIAQTVKNNIQTIRFDNPRKYNAWTLSMMTQMQDSFNEAANNDKVKAAIVTGTGDYYCAGVDLPSILSPMHPRKLLHLLKDRNQELFEMYINFPKPIFVAANGPAIGASVTSASLCDQVIASESATFHTPFSDLGIVPEGCSSYWFPKTLDPQVASDMLDRSRKIDAQEALQAGLVSQVVPGDSLMDTTQAVAEKWVAEGKQRSIIEQGEVSKLLEVNEQESRALANAFVSDPFFDAMIKAADRKGKTQPKLLFQTLKATRPLWGKLL